LMMYSQHVARPLALHSFPTRRSSDLVHHLHPNRQRQRCAVTVRNNCDRLIESDPDTASHRRSETDEPGVFVIVRCSSFSGGGQIDRKSTRLNSSHVKISYAVFCLKKK